MGRLAVVTVPVRGGRAASELVAARSNGVCCSAVPELGLSGKRQGDSELIST